MNAISHQVQNCVGTRRGEDRCIQGRVLVGKSEGKGPFGKPRSRWDDNIKMNLKEIRWETWIGLIWFRIGPSLGILGTR